MKKDVVGLEHLAGLRLDLKLNALRRETEAAETLRSEMRHLADSALLARRDDQRLGESHAVWVRQRLDKLNMELANRLVRIEEARESATRAFGQKDGLSRLAAKDK
ncbi:hypothetical protein CG51_10315 [Haematobacter missouriensis]|uniref:Uncharacterized protein n=1 Tax=Haematobacter missouriensis TaxID=366616 RepID=A0A212ARW2_9RHOB|nr:hypothetical protein [Haematobacter missouriensis]KFI33868.1 hypothetical protein CG51_10315 [Haematobacter missouriensis]OWJ77719.1 hypothetical protein CDV53_05365 [Haematobacter missouriensis]OWJ84194.1 hypothetical protein CDV52_08830 [Haematobacter missouriensis]